jgi:hypothetical protein
MELNNFPFFPDVYFKWNSPLNCFLNLSKIYSMCGEQNMSLTGLVMAYFKNPVYITTNVKTI